MKKLIHLGLGVFMLIYFSSCYNYREVAANKDVLNQKVKYMVTIAERNGSLKKVKADSVYWKQDSIWVVNKQGVFGLPASGVRVEERKVNWGKTLPLYLVGVGLIVTAAVIIFDDALHGAFDYDILGN